MQAFNYTTRTNVWGCVRKFFVDYCYGEDILTSIECESIGDATARGEGFILHNTYKPAIIKGCDLAARLDAIKVAVMDLEAQVRLLHD